MENYKFHQVKIELRVMNGCGDVTKDAFIGQIEGIRGPADVTEVKQYDLPVSWYDYTGFNAIFEFTVAYPANKRYDIWKDVRKMAGAKGNNDNLSGYNGCVSCPKIDIWDGNAFEVETWKGLIREFIADLFDGKYDNDSVDKMIAKFKEDVISKLEAKVSRAIAKEWTKAVAKLKKKIQKACMKRVAMITSRKMLQKGFKCAARKVPLIGTAVSLGSTMYDFAQDGDWKKAGMETASAGAGMVPGYGTAISCCIDAAQVGAEIYALSSKFGAFADAIGKLQA